MHLFIMDLALMAKTMYRIKTEYLLDESLTVQLGAKVENLGTTPKPDGMLEGSNGIVYLASRAAAWLSRELVLLATSDSCAG
jgi:hypothetical protein